MPEEKKLTPEQIAELKEKNRVYSKERLKSAYLNALAIPRLSQGTPYASLFEQISKRLPEKAPSQEDYEELFLYLVKTAGAVTPDNIKLRAAENYLQHLSRITVNDTVGLLGSKKKIKAEYDGKYFDELNEEDAKGIHQIFLSSMISQYAAVLAQEERDKAVGGLESMVCETAEAA